MKDNFIGCFCIRISAMLPDVCSSETTKEYPLSYGQRALWFNHLFDPDDLGQNVTMALKLHAYLDIDAYRRAIEKLVLRHAMLRTVFFDVDGQPFQRTYSDCNHFTLSVHDAATWSQEQIQDQIDQVTSEPFDLERGPLVRFVVLRLAHEQTLVFYTVHHILVDAWSQTLIGIDLFELYGAELKQSTPNLKPIRATYDQFLRDEANWLAGPEGETQLTYWKKRLTGSLSSPHLPTDFPRNSRRDARGAVYSLGLERGLLQDLKQLVGENQSSLFSVILAAFYTLLYRYTGENDLLVVTPKARRGFGNAYSLGYYINPIVLRGQIDGEMSFREFLGQVSRNVQSDFENDAYPFSLLMEKLNPVRSRIGEQSLQVFINWQKSNRHFNPSLFKGLALNQTSELFTLSGFTFESIPVRNRMMPADLAFIISESDDELGLGVEYRTNLFLPDSIKRMLDHLVVLLRSIVTNPDLPVGQLPMLTSAEKQTILHNWNQTQASFPDQETIPTLFATQVRKTPQAIAISDERGQISYGELDRRTNKIAHFLAGLGVGPGSLVGVCLPRTIELVEVLLGIQKAGGAYLILDPEYPLNRLSYMINDSGAGLLVTRAGLFPINQDGNLHTVFLDDEKPILDNYPDSPFDGRNHPANLVYVVYTSGSTGQPKGVQVLQRGLVNLLTAMQHDPGITSEDILMSVTALSFDVAQVDIFLPLVTGAQLALVSGTTLSDGWLLKDAIVERKVTLIQATHGTWRMLIAAGWDGDQRLKLITGGESLSSDLADNLLKRCGSLWNMYGPTEATVTSTMCQVTRTDQPITIGRPIANTRLYVLDNQGQPVPVGVTGELYIGGEGVALGYLNRPELTAERFLADPFSPQPGARMYRTGDLARYLVDGRVDLLGRMDQQVKLRGFRIELGEIEAVLGEHPAVSQAVAVVREDHPGDRRLVGYVTLSSPAAVGELREHARQFLPEYMVPGAFVILDAFPLTPNLKIDRKALPAPEATLYMARLVAQFPQTPVEVILAEIWSDVLHVDRIFIHDNFFDLGGHSLLATQVISRVRSTLQVDLPLQALFIAPTIARFAVVVTCALLEGDPSANEMLKLLDQT